MVMQQPMYSPDGRYLAFTATPVPRWFPMFCIYVYDVKAMKSTKVACSFDQTPKFIGWSKENNAIIFQENYHTWQNIYRLPINSLSKMDVSPERLNKNDALVTAADITAAGLITLVQQNTQQAEEVYITDIRHLNRKKLPILMIYLLKNPKL